MSAKDPGWRDRWRRCAGAGRFSGR
uniref:Uncharacterized protein n=1 Tax=Anguilla anguilla TaxID=7936 RepID=A0A0E9VRL8_ANGAN